MIFVEFIIIFNTLLKIMEMIMISFRDVKNSAISIFWRHASDFYKNISTLRLVAQCIPPPSVNVFNKFKHFLIFLKTKYLNFTEFHVNGVR